MRTRESFQYIPYEFAVIKSPLQKELEKQGHIFRGQELLASHEPDPTRTCFCGRPTEKKKK